MVWSCSCRYDLTGGYGKGGGRTRSSTQGGGYTQGGFGSPSGRSDQEHPGSRASSGAQRSSSGGGRSDQEHPASRARSHTSPVGGSGAQKPTVNSMGWGGGASLHHSQPTVPLPRRRFELRFLCRDWRGELGDHDTSALARDGAEGLGGGHGWALPCRHALALEVRLCLPPSELFLLLSGWWVFAVDRRLGSRAVGARAHRRPGRRPSTTTQAGDPTERGCTAVRGQCTCSADVACMVTSPYRRLLLRRSVPLPLHLHFPSRSRGSRAAPYPYY